MKKPNPIFMDSHFTRLLGSKGCNNGKAKIIINIYHLPLKKTGKLLKKIIPRHKIEFHL